MENMVYQSNHYMNDWDGSANVGALIIQSVAWRYLLLYDQFQQWGEGTNRISYFKQVI